MTKAEHYIAFVDEQLRARARRPADGWPRWTDRIAFAAAGGPPREPRDHHDLPDPAPWTAPVPAREHGRPEPEP